MAFSKLRSITPRGSRRRRQNAAEQEISPPKVTHQPRNEPRNSSVLPSANSDLAGASSVNLDREPGSEGQNYQSYLAADSDQFDRSLPGLSSHNSSQDSVRLQSTLGATNEQTVETDETSISNLPALQTKGPVETLGHLEPVTEDDPASYELVEPGGSDTPQASYSLEERADHIFSAGHLQAIFDDSNQLLKFTEYLGSHRPTSMPLLIYYLDALKALKAIKYANAIAESLEPLGGHEFSREPPSDTENSTLEAKARNAFQILAREDLPAFVSHTWIHIVSTSINRRITGTMPPHLREMSEGLAEVFCLTDPSRPDNPIVFASEEFYRTTQYGVSYAIGRNCRFLQGPRTNRDATRRLKEACDAGRDHCETFVNYRRDGSPFMNLLMLAPLRDSRGNLRYFIGAQVDVSGLAKECTDLEALQRMLADQSQGYDGPERDERDEFEQLTEMFNKTELDIIRRCGGRMHQEQVDDGDDSHSATWPRPRLLLKDPHTQAQRQREMTQASPDGPSHVHGKLVGVYSHYLLVRPYPSLRILFASPSLRVPGMLQSPFMNRIGSSERVRKELVSALAEGRGVTAKIRWVSKHEDEGRSRWIHCTPLLGSNGDVGVWMIVLVEDEGSRLVRRFKEAPPVAERIGTEHVGEKKSDSNRTNAHGKRAEPTERASTAMSRYREPSVSDESEANSFSI